MRVIGSKHDDRDAISSGMVEHGCTSFFRVCGWQLLLVRISRVQEVARPRADASFVRNSKAVDAASEDRETKGCDAGAAVSSTGYRRICDWRIERFEKVQTTTGVSGSLSSNILHRMFGRRT